MDLYQNKHRCVRAVVLGVTLAGILVTNCRLLVPRNGWNKQWGPLVPHKAFPGDCGICHVPDRWDILRDDFSFDHEKETGYRLEGSHTEAACLRCHNDRGPVAVYLARGCGGCHPDPHASSMGLECGRCHDQNNWDPTGLIAEHVRTRLPLIGSHAITPCESCHPGASAGQFRGAPTQCDLCHRDDLARATSPNHAAIGWTTDCQQCHVPVGWAGANIQHNFFALAGGHAGLDCAQCHPSDVFSGLSAECYACHSTNYQSAPAHVAQNYSHSCEECHSSAAWTPAAFDHTSFALTGDHDGLDCSECHTSGDTSTFSCLDCHEHQQGDMDDEHEDESGYSYNSQACYQCHPDGKKGKK